MKHTRNLLAITLAILFTFSFALAEEAPFVENGEIVATIVVGDDAPAQDVILGAEIAAYLQTFASEVATGIAKTHSQVDTEDGGVYILVGTPENNPVTADLLDASEGTYLDGPFLFLKQERFMIISGPSQSDVSMAAQYFREGLRSKGDIEYPEQEKEEYEEETVEQAPEPELYTEPEEEKEDEPLDTEIIAPIDSCEPLRYCDGDVLKERSDDCSEKSIEFCGTGCSEGACKPGAWSRFLNWLRTLFR